MDVGALYAAALGFEEREKLMVFYERACGARSARAYFRSGRRASGPARTSWSKISATGSTRSSRPSTISNELLTGNRIFKQRNVDIGESASRTPGPGFLGRDGARLGGGLGPAPFAAL